MKFVINAALYLVLVRDTKGALWALQGRTGNVYATALSPHDLKGTHQFCIPEEYGMSRRDFLCLHRALATETEIWQRPAGGVVDRHLKKETVFYRKLELKTSPVDIVEHHKAQTPKSWPKSKSVTKLPYRPVVGATCHYRTTTITLVGSESTTPKAFVAQIYGEAAKQGWIIEHHHQVGDLNGSEVTVQFTFEIGTSISKVRKHMLTVFPLTKDNHAS